MVPQMNEVRNIDRLSDVSNLRNMSRALSLLATLAPVNIQTTWPDFWVE
jgi:hypothetical protein